MCSGGLQDDIADNVASYASYLVIIGACAFAGSFGEVGLFMVASERQLRRLREAFLQAMLRKNIGWFDTQSSGALTSRLAADTKLVGDAIGEKLGVYIHFNTTFVTGLIIGFVYGWQLALVILSVTPLLGIAGFAMTTMMKNLASASNQAYGTLVAAIVWRAGVWIQGSHPCVCACVCVWCGHSRCRRRGR